MLLLTIIVIMIAWFEIGVFITTDNIADFILTNLLVSFGVMCFIITIIAIWRSCQL